MAKVTKRQAEQVLRAVKKRFKPWISAGDEGPTLDMEFSWSGPAHPAIVWEGGPYSWATLDPAGDIDEEFGFEIPPLAPVAGVWTEPATGWALSIWPD